MGFCIFSFDLFFACLCFRRFRLFCCTCRDFQSTANNHTNCIAARVAIITLVHRDPNFIRPDGESLLASVNSLYMVGFAVNFVVALLVGVWLLIIAWKMIRRSDKLAGHYGLLFTAIVLMLAWLLAGKNSFGVVNLGERFLIVAIMLLITQIQCPDWITVIPIKTIQLRARRRRQNLKALWMTSTRTVGTSILIIA